MRSEGLWGVIAAGMVVLLAGAWAWGLEIPLVVEEPAGVARAAEPVSAGIPLPWGKFKKDQPFALFTGEREVPVQVLPLVVDENGFLRWVLLDFQTDLGPKEKKTFTLRTGQPTARRTSASHARPVSSPGPRGESPLERLALSKLALNT